MDTARVSVIGAGISGLTVANALAKASAEVTLIDRSSHPGGRAVFYGCKAVDTCVRCGVCLLRDAMSELTENAGVNLLLSSSPVSFRRKNDGGFELGMQTVPNPIDWRKCTSCGYCLEACPRGAVTQVPGWKFAIDTEACDGCGECVKACPVSAIQLQREPTRTTLDADYVVVASGFQPFDPAVNRKWGYGRSPRVIHGTDLEHLFFEEKYLPRELIGRDGTMAFIQCVGSRNVMEGKSGCSRVCCAYALRMANRIKEEFPEIRIDFYYMDIQSFGRNFPEFWESVSAKINLIRSNPINVKEGPDGKPIVRYEVPDEPGCRESTYDLVSLSHGIEPEADSGEVAELIGLDVNADGFFRETVDGADGGIFVAGACKRPMRIDDSVEDGQAVSEKILERMREAGE
jgi:heterodisulfide reductase subunit A